MKSFISYVLCTLFNLACMAINVVAESWLLALICAFTAGGCATCAFMAWFHWRAEVPEWVRRSMD